MMEESLRILTLDGKKLEGLLRKPEGDGPFPVILFIPGLGMTMHEWKNSFDEISNRLVEAGFQTIQFELPIFDTKGKCRELSLKVRAKLVEEVAAKYHPTGLLAQSYGATTSLIASLPSVKSRLFVGPALSPMYSIKRVYEEQGMKVNYEGDTTMPRSSGENTTVGKEFWDDLKDFEDIVSAKRITTPICILHGSNDTKIPVQTVQVFFDAIPVKQKKLKIFKGGDHGIVDVPRPMREEFLRDVVEWFKTTL